MRGASRLDAVLGDGRPSSGSENRTISSEDAPEAVGAYSQATTNGDVFTAGQIPMTPDGELLDDEPIAVQVEIANLPKGVGVEIEAVAVRD